jgi:hypothetical protein
MIKYKNTYIRKVMHDHFGSWIRPLGGDSFDISHHFHCQILAAPSCTDVATGCYVAAWVTMRSQESQHGDTNVKMATNIEVASIPIENHGYVFFVEHS